MTFIYKLNMNLVQRAFWGMVLGLIVFLPGSFARQYNLSKGTVSFTLPAPVGELLAVNNELSGTLETATGATNFNIAVGRFRFITAAMPEHINETTTKRFREYYLETEKFPQATFNGHIQDFKKINLSKEGTYEVNIKGSIMIHGKSQELSRGATLIVKGGNVILKSVFTLTLSDYNIRVPELIRDIFFKEVTIAVDCVLRQ